MFGVKKANHFLEIKQANALEYLYTSTLASFENREPDKSSY